MWSFAYTSTSSKSDARFERLLVTALFQKVNDVIQ